LPSALLVARAAKSDNARAVSPATLFALAGSAALPALAAVRFVQFALAPAQYDDAYSMSLAALVIAQIPLGLLAGAFAGAAYIEGPAWRRAAVYLAVIVIIGVACGLSRLALDSDMGPIIGWAIAMQVAILLFAGPIPPLAIARIEAIAEDSVNLTILAPFVALIVGIAAVAWRPHDWEWSDLAWIGALYFALRAWSAAYAFTPPFEVRRKGFFVRPWIERLVRPARKGDA
jgi:hypothetical protein